VAPSGTANQSGPAEVESYGRAAARAAGLDIDEAWWPAVARHLAVLLERAASLDEEAIDLPDDPAPVFQP
jgi:phage tail tape-measure protein